MKQTLKITVPTHYSAINLAKYLEFREQAEAYKDEPEALEALLLSHICEIPVELQNKIDIETYVNVKNTLSSFMADTSYDLQRFITIDGVEYGFEPNLSKMAYGAYLDITKYETVTIDKNWASIMAVLYRPITKKVGKLYEIKPYTGEEDSDVWYNVGMDVHFGTLFFLIDLYRELLSATLNSMTDQVETLASTK
jgi:hypothetical protein